MSATRAAIIRHLRTRPGDALRSLADATGIAYETAKKRAKGWPQTASSLPTRSGYRPPDTPATGAPESVPAVPGVPEPIPTAEMMTTAGDTTRGRVSPVSRLGAIRSPRTATQATRPTP
jgi:hypothetical protein